METIRARVQVRPSTTAGFGIIVITDLKLQITRQLPVRALQTELIVLQAMSGFPGSGPIPLVSRYPQFLHRYI